MPRQTSPTSLEHLFTALISGDRAGAMAVIDEALDTDCPAPSIINQLVWPALSQVQNLHRGDQISRLSFQYATRLLSLIAHQLELRLDKAERNGVRVLVVSGSDASEELAAQLGADLLEAAGYTTHFAGGGIANDEIVEEIGKLNIDKLLVFGAVPSTVPETRLLIDRLHDIGVCPQLQIIVGGGVFNRAEGLAEEIGADLWATDPLDVVHVMQTNPQRRMTADQRTVGRRRKSTRAA